ncbi:hypothetical protein TSTA_114000 [Talaromyces stipitatus ATCC 10500]|uniref:Uncharacterized protein n=1 Tax=Talaromyces stipitatus (strain ATCC 10500 / CBS 375.48 / QM 6759 / NRRL 1006) TaxID=441959 RepID=B8MD60_TALSN|nr:uncharacterized protein TSTA_114000 [Talaromyces stipitatus ATCC 10500]EED17585.1 hypothetical protein TSTA_114000 [Talaromyces stipitatus ATCC 10500]
MVQETTARKRSSGSSSRRKRPLRLKINPPKPPRLILKPPKPPQQQATRLKMVVRSPESSSPKVDPRPRGWQDTPLLGNGEDASYDYSDICKVQAIMKVFNGISSATRKVEVAEQKLNSNERLPSDVTIAQVGALNDIARAELEMNDILQEALNCNHCEKTMRLKPESMESDIRHGIYRCTEDPPFLINPPYEDDVAPDEFPEEVNDPGYLHLATEAQQEQYLELVEHFIARNREKKVFWGMEEVDQGYESKFAFYCVDYHIHHHFVHRRSILNYCRTNEEMNDIRDWKYRLAVWTAQNNIQFASQSKETRDESEFTVTTTSSMTAPIQVSRTAKPGAFDTSPTSTNFSGESTAPSSRESSVFSSSIAPSSPSTTSSSPPKPLSFPNPSPPTTLPWPKQQAKFSNQISLHRHLSNPHERAARARSVRERWEEVMKKRAEQRRDGLIIANYEAAFTLQKWQRHRGGPLFMARDGSIGELLKRYNR